jgi:hypothetical protein
MAIAEISMAIAGARKAVQFVKAVAEAKGDFDQCIGKIHNFYNFYDTVREAEVKAQNGDYFSRNSPEAIALDPGRIPDGANGGANALPDPLQYVARTLQAYDAPKKRDPGKKIRKSKSKSRKAQTVDRWFVYICLRDRCV